jgi:hypothetical protein
MGHEAIHTKELTRKNATEINAISLCDLQPEIASFDLLDDDEI